jgi:hypothetical protein
MKGTAAELDHLLSPQAVRERSRRLYDLALEGKGHFRVHPEKLPEVAAFVLDVTRENYPDLSIPFHSRFGHFRAGGVDRLRGVMDASGVNDPKERARILIELGIVSVLLDAGAGMAWKYRDPFTDGRVFSKSEGLAIASLDLFRAGKFHSNGRIGADSEGLKRFSTMDLENGFQVSPGNPLLGVEGRVALLNRLGEIFEGSRPGVLLDEWLKESQEGSIRADRVLKSVLLTLGPIWPGRIELNGVNLGDCWEHPALGTPGTPSALIPFHKLSQWMSYSLMEPLMGLGIKISDLDSMTGLPEYRNGGLLLDSGLIELTDERERDREHAPGSELILEWRALTVTLLDRIGEQVRTTLGKTKEELPLVRILEGGTWHAGRRLASRLRSDGGPPLKLQSDGTVF